MKEANYYIETHRIRSGWIVLLALMMIAISCVALARSTSSEKPFLLLIIALLLIAISLSLLSLSVVLMVKGDKIVLSILPIPFVMLKITATEIESFNLQRIRRPPRRPFDQDTKCFLARWSHGLLIRTTRGDQLLIGTGHPTELIRAVCRLKKGVSSAVLILEQ